MIKSIFRLIRFPNLMIVVITMLAVRFLAIEPVYEKLIPVTTSGIVPFILMLLATVLTAAGGYVLNDYYDLEIDRINCPQRMVLDKEISPKTGYRIAMILMLAGIAAGIMMTIIISKPWSSLIYVTAAFLTWLYAKVLKRTLVWGNITVSFLTALTAALPFIFEMIGNQNPGNLQVFTHASKTLLYVAAALSIFAGFLNLIREIIKDIEDIEGDKAAGCKSIPIAWGNKTAVSIVMFVSMLILMILIACQLLLIEYRMVFTGIYLVLIELLLVYFLFKLKIASVQPEFHKLSILLKLTMASGIFALVFWTIDYQMIPY